MYIVLLYIGRDSYQFSQPRKIFLIYDFVCVDLYGSLSVRNIA